MGAGQSTQSQVQTSHALHVLRVTPASPASQTSIEPFFDFIVGYNDVDSFSAHNELDAAELERIVEEHEERILNLIVWSSKTRESRVVPIVPSRAWAVAQQAALPLENSGIPPQPSLLGLSMRMCEFESAAENVWHVLEVTEGSPAESAGLVPYGDWIIGWSGGVLTGENDFYDVVEAHIDKPLRVYVYSYDFDNLREVLLVPNRHWDGEGLLGCVFGFGYLHRIPPRSTDHTTLTGLREHRDVDDPQLFVPADVSRPSAVSGSESAGDQSHLSRQHALAMAHPRPTRANEVTRRAAENGQRRDSNSLSRPGTPRRSTQTPGPSSQTPTVSRSFGSPLNASPGPYSFATHIVQRLDTAKATLIREPEDEQGEDGYISDGIASVSGTEATDYGSLTSVE
ncbi:GRASP55/65 PDZ-like domain-containing protein [Melanogaster broomeanus]|nr:GRASP55/65 PDZ-like domain-containing protein [Melanogaster broomeanus]